MVKKPVIVLLCETHVTTDILDSEIEIENYNLIRCNSHSRHTGGCVIYVKSELNVNVISNTVFNANVWILAIAIISQETLYAGTYSVVYRSPNSPITEFICIFKEWCESNLDSKKTNIVCGDFNIEVFIKVLMPIL